MQFTNLGPNERNKGKLQVYESCLKQYPEIMSGFIIATYNFRRNLKKGLELGFRKLDLSGGGWILYCEDWADVNLFRLLFKDSVNAIVKIN